MRAHLFHHRRAILARPSAPKRFRYPRSGADPDGYRERRLRGKCGHFRWRLGRSGLGRIEPFCSRNPDRRLGTDRTIDVAAGRSAWQVDLDPGPGVSWDVVRRVTLLVHEVLDEHGLRGWPKTSGSRGMHVNVRIQRRGSFEPVRRAALALAREVERRAPDLTSTNGGRRNAMGCSSTTTRTPRTGPWPRPGRCGPHKTRACRCL